MVSRRITYMNVTNLQCVQDTYQYPRYIRCIQDTNNSAKTRSQNPHNMFAIYSHLLLYKIFTTDLGLFTPGSFTPGSFTPGKFTPRFFTPKIIHPADYLPLGLFTPRIIHP